jgi:O-antigen ligase
MIAVGGAMAYGVLVAALLLGAWLRPPIAVAAVACLFGLKQLGQTSVGLLASNSLITNFLVAAVVVLALLRRLLQGRLLRGGVPGAFWLVAAFYLLALLSLSWTPVPQRALEQWNYNYPYIALFVLAAPWLAQDAAELRLAFGALAVAGTVVVAALLLSAQWGGRGLLVSAGRVVEETNPLAIADLAGAAALAAMFLRTPRLGSLLWPLRLLMAAVCAFAIVRSGSRGQLLALCAALVCALPFAYPLSRWRSVAAAALGGGIVFGAIMLGISGSEAWFAGRWEQSSAADDVAGRWTMVTALLRAWSDSAGTVLFGLGNSAAFDPAIAGFYPHNVPLEILGEEGLIGFVLYLAVLVLALRGAAGGLRRAGGDLQQRGLLAAAIACLLFSWLVTLKQGNAIGSVAFFMFAILLCRVGADSSPAADVSAEAQAARPALPGSSPAFPNLMH